jgi:hypothetical protein
VIPQYPPFFRMMDMDSMRNEQRVWFYVGEQTKVQILLQAFRYLEELKKIPRFSENTFI